MANITSPLRPSATDQQSQARRMSAGDVDSDHVDSSSDAEIEEEAGFDQEDDQFEFEQGSEDGRMQIEDEDEPQILGSPSSRTTRSKEARNRRSGLGPAASSSSRDPSAAWASHSAKSGKQARQDESSGLSSKNLRAGKKEDMVLGEGGQLEKILDKEGYPGKFDFDPFLELEQAQAKTTPANTSAPTVTA